MQHVQIILPFSNSRTQRRYRSVTMREWIWFYIRDTIDGWITEAVTRYLERSVERYEKPVASVYGKVHPATSSSVALSIFVTILLTLTHRLHLKSVATLSVLAFIGASVASQRLITKNTAVYTDIKKINERAAKLLFPQHDL